MALTPYGYLLPAATAKTILDAAGVGPYDDVGPSGRAFDYDGLTYWILQTETRFPNPTANSPDGWHIVYSPSEEEKKLGAPPEDFLESLQRLITLAVIGVVIFGAVLLLTRR